VAKIRYVPPSQLIRWCRRHDPEITQKEIAQKLGVSSEFICDIFAGRKRLPARHTEVLFRMGIPPRLLASAISPRPVSSHNQCKHSR
jgi:hypothetical protein